MKKTIVLSALFSLSVLGLVGCKEDVKETLQRNLTLKVSMVANDKAVALYDTTDLNNTYDLYVSSFKLYLSQLTLIRDDGSENMVKDVALVYPGSDMGADEFTITLPAESYSKLRLGFGVDSVTNNTADPTSFPNDNPLAAYQGTYWTMLKYRFAIFEGEVQGKNDSTFIPLAYHPGTDPLYRTRTFDIDIAGTGNDLDLDLKIDLKALFDGPGGTFNFPTMSSTHSEPVDIHIARMFMDNLQAAAELKLHNSEQ